MELLLLNNAFNLVTTRYNRAVAGGYKNLNLQLDENDMPYQKRFSLKSPNGGIPILDITYPYEMESYFLSWLLNW